MRGKRRTKVQLELVATLFGAGKSAEDVARMLGSTGVAMRKLRKRMRDAGWNVGMGQTGHPLPRPED
jgi:hypothetical protein